MKNYLLYAAVILAVVVGLYEWRKRKGSALFSLGSQVATQADPNSGDPTQMYST